MMKYMAIEKVSTLSILDLGWLDNDDDGENNTIKQVSDTIEDIWMLNRLKMCH